MLQIQTAKLSQDQQFRLQPDFLANEQAYLQMRDSLLGPYGGKWVAVDDGKVLAAGPNLMEVMDGASACGGHPFIAMVGAEDAVANQRLSVASPSTLGWFSRLDRGPVASLSKLIVSTNP
jgi:hypothetical protein